MIKNQDGKGSTKGKDPDTMNAERRAKKARQKATAHARKGLSGATTMIDGLREDRQEAQAERDARRRSIEHFQLEQAVTALGDPAVTELPGLAKDVAVATIQAFPDARGDRNLSKTGAAHKVALSQFRPEEIARTSAVSLGRRRAALALHNAYEALRSA